MNIDKCVRVYMWRRHMVVTSDAIWYVSIFIYIYICWGWVHANRLFHPCAHWVFPNWSYMLLFSVAWTPHMYIFKNMTPARNPKQSSCAIRSIWENWASSGGQGGLQTKSYIYIYIYVYFSDREAPGLKVHRISMTWQPPETWKASFGLG